MSRLPIAIDYRLELKETAASTGYFTVVPQPAIAFEAGLAYLQRHPNDSFMHTYLLECLGAMAADAVMALFESIQEPDPVVRALLCEAALVHKHLFILKKGCNRRAIDRLADWSPLVFLRSERLSDQPLHRQWAALFNANMNRHRPLPTPKKTGLAYPVEGVDGSEPLIPDSLHLKAIVADNLPDFEESGRSRPPLQETIDAAMDGLSRLDIFEGGEMRHQSSLSLYALMRKWRFSHQVTAKGLNYSLSGVQTSYGRGLSLDAARASCLMEVAERCSSFVGVTGAGISGTRRPHPLIHGSRSQLAAAGYRLVDPNRLGPEVPYLDEPLHWMEGERLSADGLDSIWVPVQSVFLFGNLDERNLFSGLGSTGLASGNTIAEARLSALYELLERDSEAVNPYHPSRCFRIYAEDERMNALFEDYRARGIHVVFQDISPAFGIPCCSCFVVHRDGTVAKGGGANLNGKRAVLSALTETPYPYPVGPPSQPAPPGLPWLQFEALPDFSSGSPERDLILVERTLIANGFTLIYVEITRKDLNIPVVRALVPGFELMADFDEYSRINPRLFNNYLKIHKK